MRLSRRALLGGIGACSLAPAAAQDPPELPLTVSARPITAFSPREPERKRFGGLSFRGGLVLTGDNPRFGGLSGLWRDPDGRGLVAITDNGFWLTANMTYHNGAPARLADASLAAILGASGRPLHRSRFYDTESLTIADGVAYVGVERTHDILRFDWARDGVAARARPVPVPPEVKRLPSNRGLEAIGIAPIGSPVAGAIVAIAERSGGEDEPTVGFIIGGPRAGGFRVERPGGFDVTDLAFLPGGDLVLLERWYRSAWRGVGLRIRRVPGASLRAGALLSGETLLEADLGQEIDNMEGLAVHQAEGRTILTLVADDNFSFLQRTILLEFALG